MAWAVGPVQYFPLRYYLFIYLFIYNIYGAALASPPPWGWVFSVGSYGSPPVACVGGLWWSFPPPLWPVVVGCGGGVYVHMIDMLFIQVCTYIYIYMIYEMIRLIYINIYTGYIYIK